MTVALAVLTAVVTLVGVAVTVGSIWLGVTAAAVVGAGIGIALSSGLLEVQRMAGPRDLAGLTGQP